MSRQRPEWVGQLPYSEDQLNAAKKQIRAAIAVTAARHGRISYTDICSRVTAISLYPRSPLLAHLLASILADEKKPGGSGVAITECDHLNWPRFGLVSSRISAPPGW